jgi:hypothetical protein
MHTTPASSWSGNQLQPRAIRADVRENWPGLDTGVLDLVSSPVLGAKVKRVLADALIPAEDLIPHAGIGDTPAPRGAWLGAKDCGAKT